MAHATATRLPIIDKGPEFLDAGRFAPTTRRRLSAPGLRTFLAIADLWGLDEQQRRMILGLPSRSTYYNWVKAVREHRTIILDVDVLLRLSAVLGIHQALGVLYPDEASAIRWLNTPNHSMPFAGQPPLRFVTSGTQDGLLTVRRFLDAARGGIYMMPNELDREFRPYGDDDVTFS